MITNSIEQRISKLERQMAELHKTISPRNYDVLNEKHISILASIPRGRFILIAQIKFPEGMADRTQRKYLNRLVYFGYVGKINSGRWRKYTKVKEFIKGD